jgi:hypothetical protein
MAKKISNKERLKTIKQSNSNSRKLALVRRHRAGFLLNDKELEAMEAYCKKYKIDNRSKFMREIVMRFVMDKFLSDYPTLFDKQDLDKLKVN